MVSDIVNYCGPNWDITGTVIPVLNHRDKDPGTGWVGEKCEINDTCFSKSCDFDAGRCICKNDNDCKLDSEECSNDSSCVPFTLTPTTTPSSQPSAAPTSEQVLPLMEIRPLLEPTMPPLSLLAKDPCGLVNKG